LCVFAFHTATIAGTRHTVNDGDAKNALVAFGRYPTDNVAIDVSKSDFALDSDENFYTIAKQDLERAVTSRVISVVENGRSLAMEYN
jgi:hypothetical protein